MDHKYPSIADFRSDTVTRPSQEMRKIILAAQINVDYTKDDPDLIALELRVA